MTVVAPTVKPVSFSQTWTFFEGGWHEGNVPIMGPRTHGAWLASTVFDGARAFEGVAPISRAIQLSWPDFQKARWIKKATDASIRMLFIRIGELCDTIQWCCDRSMKAED
jgi:hypothetical protein